LSKLEVVLLLNVLHVFPVIHVPVLQDAELVQVVFLVLEEKLVVLVHVIMDIIKYQRMLIVVYVILSVRDVLVMQLIVRLANQELEELV
jgi:hypothetical protein